MSRYASRPIAKTRRGVALALLIASSTVAGPAHAQPVADLEIAATTTPPGPFAPGDVVQVQLTVTNRGPDAAAVVSVISVPYPFLDFELFTLVPGEPSPCQMFYDDFIAPPGSGQPSYLVAQIVVGALDPAESRVCTIRLDVAPAAIGAFDLDFTAINGEVGGIDNDPSNNAAGIALQFAVEDPSPAKIPALDRRSFMALCLAVLVIALASIVRFGRLGTH